MYEYHGHQVDKEIKKPHKKHKFVYKSKFMLTTIRGVYDQGQIYLQEKSPVKDRTDVIITFLINEKTVEESAKNRTPGGLKGKGSIPDDFNDPIDDLKEYM